MPKIPSYTRQNTIPGKAASVYDNSPDYIGQALTGKGGVSEDLAHTSNVLFRRQEELKKQDDEITNINLTNQYDKDLTDQMLDWKQNYTGEKSYDLQKLAQDWNNTKKNALLQNISDPVLATKIGNHFEDKLNSARLDLALFQADQRKVVFEATNYDAIDTSVKGINSGLISLTQGLDDYKNKIQKLLVAGNISKDKFNKIVNEGESKIVESHLDKLSVENPGVALEIIKAGYFDKYLTVDKLNHFNLKAQTLQKEKELGDQKAIVEKGMQEAETYESELVDKWTTGKLSKNDLGFKPVNFSELPSTVQNRYNSINEKFTALHKAQIKEDERIAKGELKSTNNAVYNNYYTRALTEPGDKNVPPELKLSHNEINRAVARGELKPQWGQTLHGVLDKSMKTANPIRQTQVTWATNEIKKAEANGLFGEKGSVEASIEMGNALEAMHQWLDENPNKNPTDFTKELLAPAVKKYIFGSTTPSEKDVKARLEKMLAPKTETPITNKPSVGGGSYKDNPVLFPENNSVPKIGEIVKGYRFKGGDPAKKESWVKVK